MSDDIWLGRLVSCQLPALLYLRTASVNLRGVAENIHDVSETGNTNFGMFNGRRRRTSVSG